MTEENFDYLKKLIEDSGHPVSLKVSTILQRKGWFVANGARYPSTQEPDVLKEIDVIGEKRSTLFPEAHNNLIIECKKQKDPWIFFKQNKKIDTIYTLNTNFAGYSYDYVNLSKKNERLFKKHYYYGKELCTYYLVGGKKIDKSGPGATIDRAINQVYGALKFFIRQTGGEFPVLYYPVIVFDGEIYEAYYKDENLETKKSDHIYLQFDVAFNKPEIMERIGTRKIDAVLSSKSYVIDVVKKEYFEKFLGEIEQRI
jgi:hypothetical protein